MATNAGKAPNREAVVRCSACGHLVREHGATGTRPCLAMVGDLLDRDFCTCDELQVEMGKAA